MFAGICSIASQDHQMASSKFYDVAPSSASPASLFSHKHSASERSTGSLRNRQLGSLPLTAALYPAMSLADLCRVSTTR
jgi:hypothetical protein